MDFFFLVHIDTNCNFSSAQDALTPRRVIFVEPVEPRRTPLPFLRPGCLRRDITAWAELASAWSTFGASSRKCRRRIWPKNGEKKIKRGGRTSGAAHFLKGAASGMANHPECTAASQHNSLAPCVPPPRLQTAATARRRLAWRALANACISLRNLAQTERHHSPPGDHPRYHDSLPAVDRENQPTNGEKTLYKCKLGGVYLRSCRLCCGRRTLTPPPQGFNETAVKKKWEKNGAKNKHMFFFFPPL